MPTIKINIDYLKTVNYALYHNRIPVCQSVELTNTLQRNIGDVRVVCEGEYMSQSESDLIEQIATGDTLRIAPFDIAPDVNRLASLTERIITSFTLKVMGGDEVVAQENYEIELMPYDHWLGSRILPQTITSFVMPNHPAIEALIPQVGAMLKQMTGTSALIEYQSGNSNDVRAQVAAAFATVHQQGVVYRSMPASYEVIGQRVTMPDQVLAKKLGNCIELTLLMASVLENIGINTVVIFQKGHAYLGVWLVDDCYTCSVCDDASFIEKKISRGIDEMLVLECTTVTSEKTSFEEAVRVAERNLADHSLFDMFIDVKRSRLEHILPLPTRGQNGAEWTFDTKGVEHDACIVNLKVHDRYDLSKINDTKKDITKYDIWERKLLDFSLRNSLLNLYLRRKAIQFISFDIDCIEDHLQDGEEYCIYPKPNVEFAFDASERLVRSKLNEPLHELISNDIEHHRLHTYQTEGETRDVLKNIYRAARNAIEETGANSLFLVIGMLRWYESPQSETPRYAPLLLLPVEMVYKKGNYYIRTRDEEISLNITLVEYLRQIHDIRINGLDPLPTDDSGVDVPLIFAAIRDALKEQNRWDVEEECLLGTFSFSKFLMWNDIHNHREELQQNNVIASLVANSLTWSPEPITDNLKDIDSTMSPAEIALPVAVDSSQMAAVIEGGKGHSYILYGPPGTGKSQTITNLIANALYQGKRVLFVAEKMAALSVVQSRLAKIGLDPFCLELHSNKVTKRHVLHQLEKALNVLHIKSPSDYQSQANKIFEQRKALIDYMNALHSVDKTDCLSLYDCILRYEQISAEPMRDFTYASELDTLLAAEGVKGVEEMLGSRFDTVIKLVGQPSKHPLNGLRLDRAMLANSDSIVSTMRKDMDIISDMIRKADELKDTPALREKLLRDNTEKLFSEDGEQLYQDWREAKAKWFLPRFFAKKSFVKRLKEYNALITEGEIDGLLDSLISYQQKHERIDQLWAILKQYLGIETTADELPELSILQDCVNRLGKWISHTSAMRDWLHWSEYSDEMTKHGMGCVVKAMENEAHTPHAMREAYLKALFKHKAEERIRKSDALVTFAGMIFDDKVVAYKRMTEEFQLLTQKELYSRLAANVPRVTDNLDSSSEIGLLSRNVSNGGRGLSMRDLFVKMPTLLPRLCPCMLMSPMSVAQYLSLANDKFDLVVFDEASQMPTCEAVGAIARGKSLIVVGDPKQMPPTSFFSSTNVDEEEAAYDDMESILEDCRTLQIPSLQLSWHYRSRHESLIAFSNSEYYDGSLITFPSVDDQHTKVHHVPVAGFYDKGGKRQNKAEAEAIVTEIERRLSDKKLCAKSIGVIAFSVVQQSLIEDMLQDLLDKNKTLHDAAEQMYEPIFVKNLENVQGDERDVILFSIGYGPNKDGKVSMNFGPLNNSGGERRLNVAVSRAREEMFIYSTLKSSDIDLRRSKARGVEGLKHFLEFVETQSLPLSTAVQTKNNDTILAQQIAERLRSKGYEVSTNIGRSQFKVDVAVGDAKRPGIYQLGILLDGEGYRDTHTTRDREIVQPSVLGILHWQIMRIWSVDWFNNPEYVISRIEEKLASTDSTEEETTVQHFDISEEQIEEQTTAAKEYVFCEMSKTKATNMDDGELIREVIKMEQPVTFMYLCRRICNLRDMARVTVATQRMVEPYLSQFHKDENGDLWLTKEDSENYTGYRPNSGRDVGDIPMSELKTVVCESLSEQVALSPGILTLYAAKKLGFARRGANVDAALNKAVQKLLADGKIESVGENVRLKQ